MPCLCSAAIICRVLKNTSSHAQRSLSWCIWQSLTDSRVLTWWKQAWALWCFYRVSGRWLGAYPPFFSCYKIVLCFSNRPGLKKEMSIISSLFLYVPSSSRHQNSIPTTEEKQVQPYASVSRGMFYYSPEADGWEGLNMAISQLKIYLTSLLWFQGFWLSLESALGAILSCSHLNRNFLVSILETKRTPG